MIKQSEPPEVLQYPSRQPLLRLPDHEPITNASEGAEQERNPAALVKPSLPQSGVEPHAVQKIFKR
jgi:hypothetical protein